MSKKRNVDNDVVMSAGAAAVPVRRSAVNRKRTTRTETPAAKSPVAPKLASSVAIADPAPAEPTTEQIAALAYSYWEARGYETGSPEADWLRAEQELRHRG
jgi:hypothetical protein